MTVAQTEIETATVPSALLGADAKRGYKETCCLSGSLLNHGMFSERSLLPSDHSFGMPDGA